MRARANKTSTRAVLRINPKLKAPPLPGRGDGWHPLTEAWWADVWSSPMGPEYDSSDRHGLFTLAVVVDDFWRAESPSMRKDLAGEIRQQSQRFGLSPLDRRRLQWEIERADEAQDKGAKRRAAKAAPATRRGR
ncbi:MAG: hypothetical protein ACRDYV_22745, partial [Acidimicrobiia bacterium]